jgi:formylglycine-generating enzyme required for sulfatase activity
LDIVEGHPGCSKLLRAVEVAEEKILRAEERKSVPGIKWIHSRPAGVSFTKTEVTVKQYRACVDDGRCSKPKLLGDREFDSYCNWEYPNRSSHPINCVDWNQANAFCEWSGGRLPTKREWSEEASNKGKRKYPWGNRKATCSYTVCGFKKNLGCGKDRTWPVCAKKRGNSVSGLCDMSGNVEEWTSTSEEPGKVSCGGSWNSRDEDWVSARSCGGTLNEGCFTRGFRCVR